MTELADFMDGSRARGAMSLHDHLTEAGYTDDFLKRKSMETQAVRAILNNKLYTDMRGTVLFPSPDTRAAWAAGVQPMEDRRERPRFSTSLVLTASVGAVIAKDNFHYKGIGGTESALVAAQRAVATASRTKQEVIGKAVIAQNNELDWVKRELELSDLRRNELELELAETRHQNAKLIVALTQYLGEQSNAVATTNGGRK